MSRPGRKPDRGARHVSITGDTREAILSAMVNKALQGNTAAIERERRAGKPICASTGSNPGYFLAANQEEMQRYCKSLLHRAGEIHKTRQACIKTMENLPA